MYKKLHKYKMQIGVFIIVFLLHIIYNPSICTITSLPTELAAFALAAKFSGYDWSVLMNETAYYGTGFYTLFMPLFLLIKDTYILHQLILFVVTIVATIPSVICYQIMVQYFEINNKLYAGIASVSLSYFAVIRNNIAINEHPLRLILWLVILFWLKSYNTNSQKQRIIYSVLIASLLGYSLTIHTRALTFIIAFFLTVLIAYLLFKKTIIHIPVFMSMLFCSVFLANRYISYTTKTIWQTTSSDLDNSISTIAKGIKMLNLLFSKEAIQGVINIFTGQVFAGNIYSCGLLGIFIVIFIKEIMNIIRCRLCKDKTVLLKIDVSRQNLFLILFCMFVCITATILMHCLLSLEGAMLSIERNTGAKVYFYLRYYFYYLQPVFMVFMVFLYKYKEKLVKEVLTGSGVCVLLSIPVFIYIAATTVENPTLRLDYSYYLAPFTLRRYKEMINLIDFAAVLKVLLLINFIIYILVKRKKVLSVALFIMILLAYEYSYLVFGVTQCDAINQYSKIDSFKEIIYENPNINSRIKTLYYSGSTFPAYVAQYEMPSMQISMGNPEETVKGELVLRENKLSLKTLQKFGWRYMAVLDENEILYIPDVQFAVELMNIEELEIIEIDENN